MPELNFDISNNTAIVYDTGLFVDMAIRLARDFKKVYYFCPWMDDFTLWNEFKIGTGIDNIERCYDFFNTYKKCQFICFPDVVEFDLQEDLRQRGYHVYGCGDGGKLEMERSSFKKIQEELGLPVNDYEEFTDLQSLREFLKDKTDRYIKIDWFRGNMETKKFINYQLSEPFFDKLEHDIGFVKDDSITFTVEEPIKDAIEVGTDLICIDGKYSDKCLYGIEIKGEAYLGIFSDYKKIPKPLRFTNDRLESLLKQYGYRGAISTEIRITDKNTGYLIDLCARQGNPPTSCQLEIIDNFSEAIYGASMGVIVPLKSNYKYCCQLQVQSGWAEKEPQPILFPEEYAQFVHIRHMAVKETQYGKTPYFIPNSKVITGVASVVGLGNTIDEAINMCKKIAKTIQGAELDMRPAALDEAKAEILKMFKMFPESRI